MTERLAPPLAEGPVSVGPEALTVGSEWIPHWVRWLNFGVGWTPVFLPEGTSSSPWALWAMPLTVGLCVCTAPSLPPKRTVPRPQPAFPCASPLCGQLSESFACLRAGLELGVDRLAGGGTVGGEG